MSHWSQKLQIWYGNTIALVSKKWKSWKSEHTGHRSVAEMSKWPPLIYFLTRVVGGQHAWNLATIVQVLSTEKIGKYDMVSKKGQIFVGSPLNPWFLGTQATGAKANCSSRNVLTEIPGGASGEETAGLWTKSGIVLQQMSIRANLLKKITASQTGLLINVHRRAYMRGMWDWQLCTGG